MSRECAARAAVMGKRAHYIEQAEGSEEWKVPGSEGERRRKKEKGETETLREAKRATEHRALANKAERHMHSSPLAAAASACALPTPPV